MTKWAGTWAGRWAGQWAGAGGLASFFRSVRQIKGTARPSAMSQRVDRLVALGYAELDRRLVQYIDRHLPAEARDDDR